MKHPSVVLGSVCLALLAGAARAEAPDESFQSAPAPPGPACLPWRTVVLSTKAADSRNALVEIMEGEEASSFLSFANSLPPVSHIDGNRVAVVFAPQDDGFIFVIGQQDCATAIMQVPRATIEQMTGQPV
jgi:hypothetical protein